MLVLTRKRDEALWLGDQVRVTVLEVGRNGVRLGIEAPVGVTILREELLLSPEEIEAHREWVRSEHPKSRAAR